MVDTVVVNTNNPDAKDNPEHVKAMLDKVDAQGQPAKEDLGGSDSKPTKPEWVPEKFWDAEKGEVRTEDLAKSYGELEGKLGAPKKDEPPAEAKKDDATPANQDEAQKQLADKGLNLEEFNAEFAKTGELSAESYEKLEKAGFPKGLVDSYVAGQKALAAQFTNEVKTVAGGDEGFSKMVEWARTNASPEEISAYNKAIDSGDVAAAKLAVAGMYGKYQEANPTEPKLLNGVNGKAGADVYESVQDYLKDSRNPEYRTNPSFRAKVIEKLGRSNIL